MHISGFGLSSIIIIMISGIALVSSQTTSNGTEAVITIEMQSSTEEVTNTTGAPPPAVALKIASFGCRWISEKAKENSSSPISDCDELLAEYLSGHRSKITKAESFLKGGGVSCNEAMYKSSSPIAYIAEKGEGFDCTEFKKRIDALKNTADPDICYRDDGRGKEALECLNGKCACPTSGIFKKFRHRQGPIVNRWNLKERRNTVRCFSGYNGYCIRNGRTCADGGKCVWFGAMRNSPFACFSGTCRGSLV